jgi:hypothetical protein
VTTLANRLRQLSDECPDVCEAVVRIEKGCVEAARLGKYSYMSPCELDQHTARIVVAHFASEGLDSRSLQDPPAGKWAVLLHWGV